MPRNSSLSATVEVRSENLLDISVTLLDSFLINHEYPRHSHGHIVIGIPLSGVGTFKVRGVQHYASEGDLVLFNCDEPHEGRVYGCCWRYISLIIDEDSVEKIFSSSLAKTTRRSHFRNPLEKDEGLSNILKTIFFTISKYKRCLYIDELALTAFSMLATRYTLPNDVCRRKYYEIDKMSMIADYIRSNASDKILLTDLAKVSDLNERYLVTAFRRRYGIPPHAFLSQVRIDAALQSIRRGAGILESALNSGFYDQSHFNRSVKRIYGFSPGQYLAAMKSR